jgi:hypothetical protein
MAHNRTKRRIAIGSTLALGLLTVTPSPSSAATESLTFNLAATAGAVTVVGEGFLYGFSQDGTGYKGRIASQARRLTTAPYRAEYVLMLSDLWGADLTQSSSAAYPCSAGNCATWSTFIDDTVAAIQWSCNGQTNQQRNLHS